jgi:hypothetical protein
MKSPSGLILIFVLSVLVCGYDVYAAVLSNGHNIVAWILAAMMAVIALSALRKLIRKEYSNSWW